MITFCKYITLSHTYNIATYTSRDEDTVLSLKKELYTKESF